MRLAFEEGGPALPEVLREVQVLGGCLHPHVLPLFGFSFDRVFCVITVIMLWPSY